MSAAESAPRKSSQATTETERNGAGATLVPPRLGLARLTRGTELILVPLGAIVVSLVIFGAFIATLGVDPLAVYGSIYKGAFGSWFSWQNTLQRAAPLVLTALCTAIPARLGLIVIGGEGAFVVGALASVVAAVSVTGVPYFIGLAGMMVAAMIVGGLWISLSGALRVYRGVNETISSLLLNYIAIAVMNHLISGPMRDLGVVHRPSSWSIGQQFVLGKLPGMNVHWGLVFGVVACVASYVLMRHTTFGFASRIVGGNPRAATIVGLPVGRMVVIACFLGGAAAGLAGMIEVAAGEGRASSSIVVGYGYTGILIAFIARQSPLAVIPAAILLGGIRASGGLLQRWHGLPDATVLVLQGIMFIMILVSEPIYARLKLHAGKAASRG
jgi:general nucleoside transport system permease protein